MDTDDLELFRAAVHRAVATDSGTDRDAALARLGWSDALALDERASVATLFEAQGSIAATSGALGLVVASSLGVENKGAAVVLPVPPATTIAEAGAEVHGITLGTSRREQALLLAHDGGRTVSAVVPLASLTCEPRVGIDPDAEMLVVASPATDLCWEPAAGTWDDALAAARRALAHEQVGAMRTMLRLAREHAMERIQFGRPIASFQAVRHHLAEALVAIEAADAALDGAWIDGTPFAAATAKAVAGASAQVVRRKAQQVLAGIGFTTEHDLQRFLRRSILLDALLGDTTSLTDEIGAQLIDAHALPRVVPL